MGIEPTPSAWKAEVLPLNYTRIDLDCLVQPFIIAVFNYCSIHVFSGGGSRIRTYEGRAVRFTV
jgi:hypothetical protein